MKLDLKFPYLIKDRIKAAKRIGEREQFAKYKAELDKVCDELLEFDDIRNFLSHGFLTLHVDKLGNHQFEYRMYQRGDGTFTLMGGTTTIERLGGPLSISRPTSSNLWNCSRGFTKSRMSSL